jgi:hypothetical protein
MTPRSRSILTIAVAPFLASRAVSPPAAGAAFERPPAGPECAALAEIVAVGPDPVFGNPAAPFDVDRLRIEAWSGHPFGIEELGESQASLWRTGETWGGGVGFRTFGTPDYFEREVRAATSFAASDIVTAGIAARALFAGGAAFVMERGYAADAGIRARLDDATQLGLHLGSVLGGGPGDPDRRLARSSIGVARALPARVGVLLEVRRRADRNPSVAGALSWSPHPALVLRGGLAEEPPSISWGATLGVGGFGVSFSSTSTDPLGRTLRVGVALVRGGESRSPPAVER